MTRAELLHLEYIVLLLAWNPYDLNFGFIKVDAGKLTTMNIIIIIISSLTARRKKYILEEDKEENTKRK